MTSLNKPLKRIARSCAPRGFNPDVIITLYPHGVIGLRELRRRKEYTLTVGELLVQAVKRDIAERRKRK